MPARWAGLTLVDRRNVAVLSAVAVTVRLWLILAYSPALAVDSRSYLDLAHRLGSLHLQGSNGFRTPGYPLLLLALGYSPLATWCVQALLGVLTTLLVYALVRRLGGGARIALAAGLLYSLDFEALGVEREVLTETLATFLLALAAYLAASVASAERPRRALLVGLGLVLAYLCLVRPEMSAVTAYLAVALAARSSTAPGVPRRQRAMAAARRASWVLVPPLAVLVAWAGVNRATIGVTSVSTVIGYNMIDHVAPYVQAKPGPDYPITSAYVTARRRSHATYNTSASALVPMERAGHLDAAHLSGRLLSIAVGVIARHPVQYVASSVKQWPRFWLLPNYAFEIATGGAGSLIRAIWIAERLVLSLTAVGFVLLLLSHLARRSRRRGRVLTRPALILAGVPIVGLLLASFLAYGDTGRYGSVYVPIVLSVTFAGAASVRRVIGAPGPGLRGRPRRSRV